MSDFLHTSFCLYVSACMFSNHGLARNHRGSIADALELRGPALNHGYTAYYASVCVCVCVCVCVYVCVCLFLLILYFSAIFIL